MPSGKYPLREQVHILYSDHHPWLLGWLRSRLGCSQQAADFAQDTFVRILGAAMPNSKLRLSESHEVF